MKKTLLAFLALVLIVVAAFAIIGPMEAFTWMTKPHHDFDPQKQAPAPDYKQLENWAAHPSKEDLADMRPEGVKEGDPKLKQVDVFYIHPTGYLKGDSWNSDMDPNTGTEENTNWMMANQASVYNDCNVYAPRYRQSTIYSFFDLDDPNSNGNKALDFAYKDVEKAFDYFINHYSNGKPFIIASHSQGSYHGLRLLKDKIDKSVLSDRMVAAYLIGMGTISDKAVAPLSDISVCNSPDQTGCLIHYATYAETAPEDEYIKEKLVCVNPITWKRDGDLGTKELHKGYVPQSGKYNLKFYGSDAANGTEFLPLGPPQIAHTHAFCKNGRLMVAVQERENVLLGEGNYHGLDYMLFHMDIRANVKERVHAYLEKIEDLTSIL